MACSSNPVDTHQPHLRRLVRSVRKAEPICPASIPLDSSKPVVFGRMLSSEVNVRLLSKCYPLMISRKHATVAFNDGQWTVTDHGTLNGVSINDTKITTNIPHPLHNGDKLTFGNPVGSEQPEFEYIFENGPIIGSSRAPSRSDGALKLRKINTNVLNGSVQGTSKASPRALINCYNIQSHGYDTRIKVEEQRLEFLSNELAMKTAQCLALQRRMEDNEKHLVAQLEEQKDNLEIEKAMAEEALEHLLNEKLKEKEQLLRSQYNEQINLLEAERKAVEEHLQTELNRKLSEQNKIHQTELEQQKQALETMLMAKESEKSNLEKELDAKQDIVQRLKSAEEIGKNLETTLNELREKIQMKESELQEQQQVTRIAEEVARKSVVETMEDEFTCIICQELFIHASTLACAHTFCKTCITSWLNKKRDCPVCRCRVQSKPVRSVVLDNAVSRVVECLDQDSKARRESLYKERLTEEQNQEKDPRISPTGENISLITVNHSEQEGDIQITYDSNQNQGHSSNSSHSRTQPNHRIHPYNQESRNRQRRGRQNGQYQHDVSRRPYQQDRNHSSNRREGSYRNNNSSHSQPLSFDTNERPWYVGAGQCYMCGMRGHYARECPFRR